VSAGSAHIVHVVTTLGQGGAEKVCCQVIQRNCSDRHTVIKLFAGHGLFDDDVARAAVAVHCLGLPRSTLAFMLLPFAFIRLLWLLMVLRPKVIVGWLYYGALAASIGRFLRLPVLWSLHAADFDPRTSFKATTRAAFRLCRFLSRRVPTFIHYCSDLSRVHHERLGFAIDKSVVIENGVDVDQLATVAADDLLSLSAGGDFSPRIGTKLIGCIARLEPQKDHRTLFEAVAKLKVAGKQVSLILAGHNCHRHHPRLRALLNEFDLDREVIPLGVISEVGRLMQHCDAIVLSSCEGEALPMVLLEALSVGKPVVATNIGNTSIIVGDFGLVVPPRNAVALSKAIEQVVWVNPAYREAAAGQAPSYIRENYSLDNAAERWKTLISRAVGLTEHLAAGR
jgi:glycosyltransferase involved in cell wall biosynthesis